MSSLKFILIQHNLRGVTDIFKEQVAEALGNYEEVAGCKGPNDKTCTKDKQCCGELLCQRFGRLAMCLPTTRMHVEQIV